MPMMPIQKRMLEILGRRGVLLQLLKFIIRMRTNSISKTHRVVGHGYLGEDLVQRRDFGNDLTQKNQTQRISKRMKRLKMYQRS
jgi:hypothetical protein